MRRHSPVTSRAPNVFSKVELLVDSTRGYKQLVVDGRTMQHVQEVLVRVGEDPLASITVTFLTDDLTVAEASLPREDDPTP